jgi:hypothetical protein
VKGEVISSTVDEPATTDVQVADGRTVESLARSCAAGGACARSARVATTLHPAAPL